MAYFSPDSRSRPNSWIGWLVWCLAWASMAWLDGRISMPNLALLLVLGSAVAGVWLSPIPSLLMNVGSVAFFSFFFVDPRLDFWPSVQEDLLLVITTLVVSTLVSTLTARLRRAVANEALQTERVTQLRRLSEAFRESEDLIAGIETLLQILRECTRAPAYAVVLNTHASLPAEVHIGGDSDYRFFGQPPSRIRKRLRRAVDSPLSESSSPSASPDDLLFCSRIASKTRVLAAVCISDEGQASFERLGWPHLKSLCDALGAEAERVQAVRQAAEALEKVNSQALRNTLLTSISHDYRTPLATIMGAASALAEQPAKYSPEKIAALAATILAESEHLSRMTTSTLQLVRLGSAGSQGIELNLNWESLEELASVAAARLQRSFPSARIELSFPATLPLLYCDAILILQMLDNLLINSLKYSPENSPIMVEARRDDSELVLCVTDHGPGIPAEWREKVFDAFQRLQNPGQPVDSGHGDRERRGFGLGLAVCRAIALAHDARIRIGASRTGGAQVLVTFPLKQPPAEVPAVLEEIH